MFSGAIGFVKLEKLFFSEIPLGSLPVEFIDKWCMEKIENALLKKNPRMQTLDSSLILAQISEIQKVRSRVYKAKIFPSPVYYPDGSVLKPGEPEYERLLQAGIRSI